MLSILFMSYGEHHRLYSNDFVTFDKAVGIFPNMPDQHQLAFIYLDSL